MSLESHNGANSLQLYGVSSQYPSSISEYTYPASNPTTQGSANYVLLSGTTAGCQCQCANSNATSESGYGNSGYSAPGSNSNAVYLTSPSSQSTSQAVARYPSYTTSGYSQPSVPQTYPNRSLVINPSANSSSYNAPQSSQAFSSGSVSNSGVVARCNIQSYNKTTVISGSSYTKVETYSKRSVEQSFVQYPATGGSGTIQPDSKVYTAYPSSNGNGTVAYYPRSGYGF